jgi:two-component system phosphate regulon sensor histidine kinase PhoR
MSRFPLGFAFAFGALAAGGCVAVVGLIGMFLIGTSEAAAGVVLALALVAGIAGGMISVGWAQRWRDAVRNLAAGRATGVAANLNRWPVSLARVHERLEAISGERDTAIATQGFVQQRLEAIVTGLRDGVIVIDPDLTIISINEPACRMLGTSQRTACGRPLVEVARDFDVVRVTRDTVERGVEQSTPIDYRRAGKQFHLRVMPIEQGGRRLAILVIQDITDVRQLENVRRDFVANVSHELRTPLAAIRALVETLDDGAIDDETVAHDFLHRVVDEVDRLNELIEDLLDLGRLESGRLPLRRSEIDAGVLIGRAVERVAHIADSAGVEIEVREPGDLRPLFVDPSRAVQVLVNLLHNAIKFSPRGARVEVCTRESESGIAISVRDYGAGILPEDLPRIFERFFKSDRARQSVGSGLGLAIAKHIVGAHGGQITADSEYEKGSVFTVVLPVSDQSAAA